MYRIDDATAASSLPAPEAAATEGYFTEGNPVSGVPATNVRGSWLNMIQEELRALVVYGGLTPSKTIYTQVRDAIVAKFAKLNGDSTQTFSVAPGAQNQNAVQLGQFKSAALASSSSTTTTSVTFSFTPPANGQLLVFAQGGSSGASSGSLAMSIAGTTFLNQKANNYSYFLATFTAQASLVAGTAYTITVTQTAPAGTTANNLGALFTFLPQ
ncbi:hypothetical protein [Paraburkholderia bannensis]|uniref:hypothetical protein n=1 Tax=Paraburkholderia bannensis TaxID=765414 RepID=UPI002ABD31B7|nr:hypothetical protein [Paraburkholderia bannensis]